MNNIAVYLKDKTEAKAIMQKSSCFTNIEENVFKDHVNALENILKENHL